VTRVVAERSGMGLLKDVVARVAKRIVARVAAQGVVTRVVAERSGMGCG
jgi:hypothetical protein